MGQKEMEERGQGEGRRNGIYTHIHVYVFQDCFWSKYETIPWYGQKQWIKMKSNLQEEKCVIYWNQLFFSG